MSRISTKYIFTSLKMLRITLALFIVGEAYAQVNSPFRCPTPKGLVDFDVSKFAGKWYEIAKYTNRDLIKTKCATDNYVLRKDGSFELTTTQTTLAGNKMTGTKYTLTPRGDPRNGKFEIKSIDEPHDILGTNYNEWALISYCKTYGHVSVRAAVILTKSRTPLNQVTGQAYAAAKAINLKQSDFTLLNQQDCPKWY